MFVLILWGTFVIFKTSFIDISSDTWAPFFSRKFKEEIIWGFFFCQICVSTNRAKICSSLDLHLSLVHCFLNCIRHIFSHIHTYSYKHTIFTFNLAMLNTHCHTIHTNYGAFVIFLNIFDGIILIHCTDVYLCLDIYYV